MREFSLSRHSAFPNRQSTPPLEQTYKRQPPPFSFCGWAGWQQITRKLNVDLILKSNFSFLATPTTEAAKQLTYVFDCICARLYLYLGICICLSPFKPPPLPFPT